MKSSFLTITILIVLLTFLSINNQSYSQTISCQELFEIVTENYDRIDRVTPLSSTMLAKVNYYTLEGAGFVVAYIKKNDFDFQGSPYIFCGISSQRWAKFKSEGMFGSWGESFHAYIRDYTCNCY